MPCRNYFARLPHYPSVSNIGFPEDSMRRIISLAAAVALLAVPVFAGKANLGKFDDWADTPVAYFLTSDERTQWAALADEAAAEKFVDAYVASRGGKTFTDQIAQRAGMADKYLTIAKTPGSKTLRGKVVIVFGPPAAMDVAAKPSKSRGRSGTPDTALSAGGGDGRGASIGEVASVALRDGMENGDSGLRDYTLTYNFPEKKGVTIAIEANTHKGTDRVADRKAAAELDALFETAAKASIKQ